MPRGSRPFANSVLRQLATEGAKAARQHHYEDTEATLGEESETYRRVRGFTTHGAYSGDNTTFTVLRRPHGGGEVWKRV